MPRLFTAVETTLAFIGAIRAVRAGWRPISRAMSSRLPPLTFRFSRGESRAPALT